MKYCEFPAVPVLQRYVECFWSITGEQEATESKPGRVTPDGGVEIVLSFADAMRLGKLGEPLTTQPRRLIIGQLDQSADNLSKGRTDYLGIRFRPAGVYAFLAAPQHELTGRFVSLEEIAPALDRELESRLDDAQTPAVRVRVLQEVLLRHLQRAAPQSTVIEAAVRAIEETHGCITISTLMNQFDLSGRQIERLFHQYVGLSPKSLCRILRFRRVFRAAEYGQVNNWAELALLAGYYDQAHLLQDFRQFAGSSPTHLFTPEWLAASDIERL